MRRDFGTICFRVPQDPLSSDKALEALNIIARKGESRMNTRFLSTIGFLVLFGLATVANAASISLAPTSSVVDTVPGDLVSFDVFMDFTTDNNGLGSDITLGGGFDIVYDSSVLAFVSLSNAELGDPAFGRDPDILDGLLESWGFADFNGLTGPALVGSVQFEVLAALVGDSTLVSTTATNGISGPFVSAVDFITILQVDYNEVEVNAIPVPGAVWLFGSGLGLLGWLRRRTSH